MITPKFSDYDLDCIGKLATFILENKQWELYHIPTTCITKVFINRLWEIYNDSRF